MGEREKVCVCAWEKERERERGGYRLPMSKEMCDESLRAQHRARGGKREKKSTEEVSGIDVQKCV